ncbi:MAG: hypothetical protein M3335_11805 [Actinomycetota bacterium]|nr:hypothetical protein [Actinomycetota bacterium]
MAVAVAFSPATQAATRIVAQKGVHEIVSLPPSGGSPQTLFRLEEGAVLSVGASRDGRRIAFATRSWKREDGKRTWIDRIWTMDGRGGNARVVKTFTATGRDRGPKPVAAISMSPDGRRILITKRHGLVFLMGAEGSTLRPVSVPGYSFGIPLHTNYSGPEFTPDGRHIIDVFHSTGDREDRIRGIGTVPLRGGRVHFLRSGPVGTRLGSGSAPTISRDGRFIAFAITRHRGGEFGTEILLMRRDGSGERSLKESRLRSWIVVNPSFSPSGKALAFAATKTSKGGIYIGQHPSLILTIRRDGTNRRVAQSGKAQTFRANPLWTPAPF